MLIVRFFNEKFIYLLLMYRLITKYKFILPLFLLVFVFASCHKGGEPKPHCNGVEVEDVDSSSAREGDGDGVDDGVGVVGGDDNEDDDGVDIVGGDDNEDDDITIKGKGVVDGAGDGSGASSGGF